MYPNKDAPRYLIGFTATCCLLAICIVSYATLPLWLLFEAKQRKRKTGHALPLQAMIDSENSQVTAETRARIQELNAAEEMSAMNAKERMIEEGRSEQLEFVEQDLGVQQSKQIK